MGEVAEYWDGQAGSFDDRPDHGLRDPAVRSAWATLLLGRLRPAPARVADVGCGTGSLSVLLAENGYRVSGIDLSARMIGQARLKAARSDVTADFRVGDAAAPPWPERAFDVVLCRHVLWALPDPGAALDRWLRLVPEDGQLVLIEGRWWTGGGLGSSELLKLLGRRGRSATLVPLQDAVYWGGGITDERFLVVSPPAI